MVGLRKIKNVSIADVTQQNFRVVNLNDAEE